MVGPSLPNPGIWMMNGFSEPEKISNIAIDRDLSSSGIFATAISSYSYGGYTYCLFASAAGTIFLYCVEQKAWTEQTFPSKIANSNYVTGAGTGPMFIDSGTAGKVYSYNQTPIYTDNGAAFTMTIQTEPKVPNGGKGFTMPYIDLLADNQSSGFTTLEISRDDYGTWQTIGTFDLTKTRKRIYRCGYCRSSAAFRLSDAGNNAWRGQALIVNYEPCAA